MINRIKSILKNNILLLFIHNFNNKIFKQTKYLKSFKLKTYNIKTFLLNQIYIKSTKRLWLYSLIKNSISTLLYYINTHKIFKKMIFLFSKNQLYLFSIKFNNKLYALKTVKNMYSFNYYFSNKLISKFLSFVLKKFNRNNVNWTHLFSSQS